MKSKHYQRGVFRNPLEQDGWNQNVSRKLFLDTMGSKRMKRKKYENLTNKGFGQLYLVVLACAWMLSVYITKELKLPTAALLIMIPLNYYLLLKIPTQIILYSNLRKFDTEWENHKSDLF